jgi:hypothetical protein
MLLSDTVQVIDAFAMVADSLVAQSSRARRVGRVHLQNGAANSAERKRQSNYRSYNLHTMFFMFPSRISHLFRYCAM